MAHRIVKKQQAKQHIETAQTVSEPADYFSTKQPQPSAQSPQPGTQNKLPRPLLLPSDTIITHDKFAYKQNKPAFPPP